MSWEDKTREKGKYVWEVLILGKWSCGLYKTRDRAVEEEKKWLKYFPSDETHIVRRAVYA